ncbi:alpha-L-rhamnosidase [Streptomyces pseudovenezuelae]|uniref:alpha-L-rhamnosidase n=1 Tax=Streptomyces pseudovenezuelae TaxID=67350 RepID=A0ABT6LVK3_9ACTN|nr:alpha-L-rhamnosidase [Streptomyces pseudovenezuelae]MDH6220355.1 alpha-L-rhamnosidase [Streptomyces pseudovenezuelae]
MHVTPPTFEHHREPLGIGESAPRLSWRTVTDATDWRQAAHQVEITAADGTVLAGTGRVESADSVLVPWPGPHLGSRERVGVRVRVWGDTADEPSPWSRTTYAETGLLEPADWTARPVTPDHAPTDEPLPVALLRHDFTLTGPVASARLYITAYGVYAAEINGEHVGDHVLSPGWTSYQHRLRYQTFDVTPLLRTGENTIGALLGEGWYTGRLGFHGGRRHIYGEHRALLAQLEITYADGTTRTVRTDEHWRTATGPALRSEIYDGEVYDARRERPGWSTPGHDTAGWAPVLELPAPRAELVAPTGPPVRRTQTVAPVAVTTTPSGKTVLDFGQNLVGRLRIRVSGAAGHEITLRHAEVLEHGELCTRPLRFAAATDTYVLRGEGMETGQGVETYEPHFTFHGFRYAEIGNWPGPLDPTDIEAVVLHTDMARTGWFECSDPLVNQLHENVVQGMRGNFLDVPTDCPQRDERMGWTGDIQVFAPTATFLHDWSGMLTGWLRDLSAEQLARPDGVPPLVVPDVLPDTFPDVGAQAVWADVAVLLPWTLYQRFGDLDVLRTQYPSMRAWGEATIRLTAEGDGLWRQDFQLGDWLDPQAPPDRPGESRTDGDLVANAYVIRSAEVLAEVAGLLDGAGHLDGKGDAARFRAHAQAVRERFADHYVTPDGLLSSDTQTAYALAIAFSLLPTERQRRGAAERLAQIVRRASFRIATGFTGTPLICDALCAAGEPQLAYRMLLEKGCPSWLYPVTMGATTVWERWDSMLPDGTVNPGEMTSFNHYALGAVADWLHRTVAGLAAAEPGWRRLRIAPVPGGGLRWARAAHDTPYGRAEAGWRIEGDSAGTLVVETLVPPGIRAEVQLPDGRPLFEIGSGRHTFQCPYADPA